MRIDERMTKEHGSVRDALVFCASQGMYQSQIAHHYKCTKEYVRKMANLNNVILPVCSGYKSNNITSPDKRKALTSAVLRGEELTRQRLIAQVTTYTPDHPMFAQVAAEIMARRAA